MRKRNAKDSVPAPKLLPAPRHHMSAVRFFSFPSGSRIAASVQKTLFWAAFICLALVNTALISSAFGLNLFHQPAISHLIQRVYPIAKTNVLGASVTNTKPDGEDSATGVLTRRYASWQAITEAHPDYRDGYYMLAVLAYELHKPEEAKSYAQRVYSLDPNFPQLDILISLIAGSSK